VRSITFISAFLIAGEAIAQGAPTHGCFARDYGADHLASHPDQIVARMVVLIGPATVILPSLPSWREATGGSQSAEILNPDQTWMRMAVETANQGHVATSGHGGQRFEQALVCGGGGCGVECDGGGFEVERDDGDTLQFVTDRLMVGVTDECGGAVDIAELPGKSVSYRLTRVPDALCEREFGG
jgi:hypothetical protein